MNGKESIGCNITLAPDGISSWIAKLEVADWELTISMPPFYADGDNEAVFQMNRFVQHNAEYLRSLGPGHLSLVVPSRPKFTPASESVSD